MKTTTSLLRVLGVLTVAIAVGVALPVHGGGLRIPDQSTRAMGMMDAFVAGADDASAVAYNPAGLTRLQGPEGIANLYFAHADVFYSEGDANQTSNGRYFTLPNFYLATPLDAGRKNFLGLGVNTPFGLGSRWGDNPVADWARAKPPPGGTVIQESEVQLVNINPTFARKVTDKLSLGAGLDYYISRVRQRSWVNFGAPVMGRTILDASGRGWGYNFGLTYDFTPQVAFGASYRSRVSIDYQGEADFEDIPPGSFSSTRASTKITYPQSLAAGLCWKPVDRFRLEFTAEWMDWSEWDQRKVKLGAFPLLPGPQVITSQLDWHDSWILSLGGEYELTEKWRLRAGYGFNETPTSKKLGDVDLPTGNTHALTLGAGYQMTPAVSLDTALIVAYSETRELDASSAPPGSDFWALSTYFSLGITYRF